MSGLILNWHLQSAHRTDPRLGRTILASTLLKVPAWIDKNDSIWTSCLSSPHLCDFKSGLRGGWMLRESRRVSPVPGRQQEVQRFSSGFCFRLVFVSKQRLYQNMFPPQAFSQINTHTHRHTCPSKNGTLAGVSYDMQEVSFVLFIQGSYML